MYIGNLTVEKAKEQVKMMELYEIPYERRNVIIVDLSKLTKDQKTMLYDADIISYEEMTNNNTVEIESDERQLKKLRDLSKIRSTTNPVEAMKIWVVGEDRMLEEMERDGEL